MRADLRRECDDIWVIDCSPEGHQPEVSTRIFQGVQHPVCVTIASRSPSNDPEKPARVHYRSIAKGRREEKFEQLKSIALAGKGWLDGASDWRAPFLPQLVGGWADFVPLDSVMGDCGSGVMPGRTWVIAPDAQSLERRWKRLLDEKNAEEQSKLFHPHEGGDRTITKAIDGLPGQAPLASIDYGLENRDSADPEKKRTALDALKLQKPVSYGFRSFDRQWIVPDKRLINRPNPKLWENYGSKQVYLTAQMDRAPSNGPGASLCGIIPDLHHYAGRGGRVFALYEDAGATSGNIKDRAISELTKTYGAAPKVEDVFAYVAALLANPAYTEKFRAELVRPGLRVPMTADKNLFAKAADIGRKVIWLHTFGERFADPAKGRPVGQPKLPDAERPKVLAGHHIPDTPQCFPDTIGYDPAKRELKIGTGVIAPVAPEVWAYEVSGKQVLRQWFSYRKKNREKPQIGDRRPPSPLGEIQPDHWLPEYTTELLNVINVLGLLVKLEPEQAKLLDEIVEGPMISADKIS
jgi:hypothetical protein